MAVKTWELTLNNFTEEEKEQWIKILTNEEIVTRAVVGIERGEEKRTPHFQGRVTFRTSKRMNAVKKLLGSRIHAEKTKAKNDWSYYYKGEVFIDVNFGKQGKRSDLAEIKEKIEEGASVSDIAREYPGQFIRYANGIRQMHELLSTTKIVTGKHLLLFFL